MISSPLMPMAGHQKHVWAATLIWLGFAAAAAGEPVIFSAMGCGPYTPADKPAVAFYVQQESHQRTSEVMVYLGDVFKKSPIEKSAPGEPLYPDQLPTEAEYRWTADLLTTSNTSPTWIVPGDNEW